MKKSRLLLGALAALAMSAAFALSPPVRESPPGSPQVEAVKSMPAAGATLTITADSGLGAASALKAYEAQRAAHPAPVQRAGITCHEEDDAAPVLRASAPPGVVSEPWVRWRIHWLRT